jgi:hypothetical protein
MKFGQKAALAFAAAACIATPTFAQSSPAAVVQAHVDAYRAADFSAFLNTFSDDAVLISDGQRFVGKAQLRQAYAINFQQGAPSIYIAGSEMRDGKVVLSEGYVFADGTDVCCSLSTYTVAGGKITKVEVYSPR